MLKPAAKGTSARRFAFRLASTAVILIGTVLAVALLWVISHREDHSSLARTIITVVALPFQVLLATLRLVTLHDFGLPAMVLAVTCVEAVLFALFRILRRQSCDGQSRPERQR
jgi:hypothetical protein